MRDVLLRIRWPERAALLLLVAWMVWAVTAAGLVGRILPPTSPYVVAPVALVAGVVLGRLVAPHVGHWATALTVLAATAYLLLAVLWTSGPAKGPLSYANANAALAVQLIGLCGLIMVRTTGRRRAMAALSAVLALGAVVANYSIAGFAVALPVVVVVVGMMWRPARRRVALAAAILGFITVVSAALVVAVLAMRPNWPGWVLRALDPARQVMWQDAIQLWQRHPAVGAGPGTYQEVSRLGYDADTATAHSSVLQIGAETGWVGVALFVAVVIAGLLWACRGNPANAVIGVAAWTALLVHSFADHLLEFVPVVLAAGMVLGWAGTHVNASERINVSEDGRPTLP